LEVITNYWIILLYNFENTKIYASLSIVHIHIIIMMLMIGEACKIPTITGTKRSRRLHSFGEFSEYQLTSYMEHVMLRVNFFYIKNTKKNLKFKSIRFFYKAISKNLGSGYNVWPKSNIYNINNNIKLAWPGRSSCNTRPNSLGCGSGCKVVS